ncbi:AbiH family protein [Oenococcus oeni]|uniref:AbiH family protein n=1 Tax=Oenococcus oeni TaxID=1247 RepID=UPI0009B58112|nr:AbiH family protein [Oenococcus oeni]
MTEEKKELNQLVIIGNGFDLRCGLSSKYQDFLSNVTIFLEMKKLINLWKWFLI